jgi:hypothetical protein
MKSKFTDFKSIKKILGIIFINILLTFVALEAVSLAFYFLKEKQFYYTSKNQPKSQAFTKDLEKIGVRLNEEIVERFHPYFGYVTKQGAFPRPDVNLKVNNYGFYTRYNYPFLKQNKNQYIIGIFGGSVANDFVINDYIYNEFTRRLKKSPFFANKEIILLNFGNGGYKQPQQLLILNYLLAINQQFDMVINLDGFNEIALANVNNTNKLDFAMPSFQHIQPLTGLANNNLSFKVLQSMLDIRQTKKSLSQRMKDLDTCSFALCYTARSLQVRHLINQYQEKLKDYEKQQKANANQLFDKNNVINLYQSQSKLSDEQKAYDQMISLWYQSSLTMSQVLKARKIPYFHFIQPNQYYPSKRVFTEEEKKLYVVTTESPYSNAIKIGYPQLLSKVEDLRKEQVNIFSAVNVLDGAKETVYRDNCCHYNNIGQNLLGDYISEKIINVIKEQK